LIEELPYHQSERTAAQFRCALLKFLQQAAAPAVMVFTEENEDRYGVAELEKQLGRDVLQAPGVEQIHCNPVTDSESLRGTTSPFVACRGGKWDPRLWWDLSALSAAHTAC
jgi:hypothetical protein